MKKFIKTLLIIIVMVTTYKLATAATTADAELSLEPSVTSADKGETFTVDVVMKNPSAEKIISVRSWLSYDAKALEAESIDTKDSLFTLSAPGEDTISSGEGYVKIGRSNISGGVTSTETTVATVTFKVLTAYKATSKIEFYDYQVSELGHTSVNIIDSGFPLNILAEEPEALSMSLNPGGTVTTSTTTTPTTTSTTTTTTTTPTTTATTTTTAIGGSGSNLVRPTNLKVNTGSGYVDLVWDDNTDSERVGYNIYYGSTSGQYSRRRSIGDVNSYRLTGLNDNDTYYLAVTAYDLYNNESDYSNEVGIIVNQPLSSTDPITSLLQASISSIPSQPQNGPLTGWLLFSAAGLSAALLFGKRKTGSAID